LNLQYHSIIHDEETCMKHLIILFLFLTCNSYAAGIQKWVDENGQVHYGDSPPTQVTTESIRISRPPSNPGKTLPRINSNSEAKADDQQAQPAAKQPAAAPEPSAEQAKQFCEQARKDLVTINRSNRLRLKLADGTTRFMTDEEISARREQTQADIDRYCK
jgi:hypothetical protein